MVGPLKYLSSVLLAVRKGGRRDVGAYNYKMAKN